MQIVEATLFVVAMFLLALTTTHSAAISQRHRAFSFAQMR